MNLLVDCLIMWFFGFSIIIVIRFIQISFYALLWDELFRFYVPFILHEYIILWNVQKILIATPFLYVFAWCFYSCNCGGLEQYFSRLCKFQATFHNWNSYHFKMRKSSKNQRKCNKKYNFI